MKIYEDLIRRGLISQMTDEEECKRVLDEEHMTFYIGFDATADSLTAGHFLQLMTLRRLQKAGHRPIVLIGGGTTMVGDPTGRSDMRSMLTKKEIEHNAECFKLQMQRFIDFSDDKAIMLNNADWLLELNYVDFLREVGVHFSVNKMLTADSVKTRLEKGLSFLEFNYMLMQSYDFLKLYQTHDCSIQIGGSDQWGNIVSGVELIRKVEGAPAYGITFALLTTKDGVKMGKSQKGAVWLDANKTSPYEFFQYWRNIGDEDVFNTMKFLTEIPIEEIESLEKLSGEQLNPVKERLAYELTMLVHGKNEADSALAASKAAFSGMADENMPSTKLFPSEFSDGYIGIIELLIATQLAPSKGEARRLIEQGGITVGNDKIADISARFTPEQLNNTVIKKGKKIYHKIEIA